MNFGPTRPAARSAALGGRLEPNYALILWIER